MKNRRYLLYWLFALFPLIAGTHKVYSQSAPQTGAAVPKAIRGLITDEGGKPIPGVSVAQKGTTTGTTTDPHGLFELKAAAGDTIYVRHIGYKTKEFAVTASEFYNVELPLQSTYLGDVVVTALGIKRSKKELSYAVGEVKGEELNKAKEMNVVNSLAGREPGVIINQTAGGPGGSTRILIRGNTSLTGNNQPLFVVDGVPLDNTNFGSAGAFGGFDLGDGMSTINPDDVETISVLKGPAAAALYGSRAAHGVVLVTTKKGKTSKNNRLGVEINSNTTVEFQATKYDHLQKIYGQGFGGILQLDESDSKSSSSSWGPKYDKGLMFTSFDKVARPFVNIRDNIDGFFRTGITATNAVSLNSVKENNNFRMSYTNLANRDIMPNARLARNTVDLRNVAKIGTRLELDLKVNYLNETVLNRPALSDARTNVANNLMNLAGNIDQRWLRDNYKNEDGTYYDWNRGDVWNINPYWIQYAMENKSNKDKYFGVASLKYDVSKDLFFKLTGGGENVNFRFMDYVPYSTPGELDGKMQETSFENRSYNIELIGNYRKKIKDIDLSVTLGGNIYNVNNRSESVLAKNMILRETVSLQSFLQKEITKGRYQKEINSLFSMVNLSYRQWANLDLTLRRDQSSTLPLNNNTYYYPSVGGNIIFTELLPKNAMLNFGKIRASWAQVGSDTDPYMLDLNYRMTDKTYDRYPTGYISSTVIPNSHLKPTKTNSIEAGLDLKMVHDRVGLSVTYYNQTSNNQIMYVPTSVSSGYAAMLVNAGNLRNAGVEIALSARIIDKKDFSWDLNPNFARNVNKVLSLTEGIESLEIAAARWLGVKVLAIPGEEYGVIMGQDFVRNEEGRRIINPDNGLPEVGADMKKLGRAMWKWTGGGTMAFRYKNFNLSAVFDAKFGADLFTMTARTLTKSGKTLNTVAGRDAWMASEEQRLSAGIAKGNWKPTGGFVADGVIAEKGPDGTVSYKENDIYIDPNTYWDYISDKTAVPYIYDNSYVKVREIIVGYTFPQKRIGGFAESLTLSFVARNPWIVYKNVPNIDPDSNYNTSAVGLEYGSIPTRRSFGLNINAKF